MPFWAYAILSFCHFQLLSICAFCRFVPSAFLSLCCFELMLFRAFCHFELLPSRDLPFLDLPFHDCRFVRRSLLRSSTPSKMLDYLYRPPPPLQPSVPSIGLCPLFSPLYSLQSYVPSTASVRFMALYYLDGPLSPLRLSLPPFILCMASVS